MPRSTDTLLALLDLEPIERNIYRGRNRDIGSGRIFGGQVLAQALVAARRTIEQEDRAAHSLHGYFILEGDLEIPVVYFVDCLRDGKSFTTRNVAAIQHGRAIFALSASFHRTETSLSHQAPMPDVPPPEDLRSELEIVRDAPERIPAHLRAILTQNRPLDFRPVDEHHPFDREARAPVRRTWVKALGALGDKPVHHQAALAYASDYGILSTALQPHGRTGHGSHGRLAGPLHVVPPALQGGRLAALRRREPHRTRSQGVRARKVLHPGRDPGRLRRAGGAAAHHRSPPDDTFVRGPR